MFDNKSGDGTFIDSDGIGYYSNGEKHSTINILPSDTQSSIIISGYTHVNWINK